jgi:hypothetical protein
MYSTHGPLHTSRGPAKLFPESEYAPSHPPSKKSDITNKNV